VCMSERAGVCISECASVCMCELACARARHASCMVDVRVCGAGVVDVRASV
jgi:hypothetical protein